MNIYKVKYKICQGNREDWQESMYPVKANSYFGAYEDYLKKKTADHLLVDIVFIEKINEDEYVNQILPQNLG